MAFPALLDTNALFCATLTDTLLRLAEVADDDSPIDALTCPRRIARIWSHGDARNPRTLLDRGGRGNPARQRPNSDQMKQAVRPSIAPHEIPT